jgi:hypothetical protein
MGNIRKGIPDLHSDNQPQEKFSYIFFPSHGEGEGYRENFLVKAERKCHYS